MLIKSSKNVGNEYFPKIYFSENKNPLKWDTGKAL